MLGSFANPCALGAQHGDMAMWQCVTCQLANTVQTSGRLDIIVSIVKHNYIFQVHIMPSTGQSCFKCSTKQSVA